MLENASNLSAVSLVCITITNVVFDFLQQLNLKTLNVIFPTTEMLLSHGLC